MLEIKKKPWRWDKFRKSVRTLLRTRSIDEIKQIVRDSIDRTAAEQGWRDSERIMAISDRFQVIEEVQRRMRLRSIETKK